jgi:hypothetical protein
LKIVNLTINIKRYETLKLLFWGVFAIFFICALGFGWHDKMFVVNSPLSAGKYIVWAIFLGFLSYSIYCSSKENLFKTIGKIAEFHWGRQIGIDLYLGLSLTLFIIYLNEGSILVVALWLLPVLIFANLATLLYFAIHFDSIIAKFLT